MNERKLTKSELAKREDIIMKMKKNKRALTQKYGKDAEAVMYGRATKLAKKQAEAMDQDKIKELVKDALQNPKKADLNKDGKLSDYEKKRGAAIEKAIANELDATEKAASDKIGRGEEFTDDDAAAVADKMPKIGKDKEFKLMGEEDLDEDLDLGHQDNEPHMLKADLYRIGKYAMELYQMVDRFEEGSEEVDFPHWWQSKVIKAKDMLVSAKHYLDFEIKEPQIDAMVDVASKEEVIDEPVNEGTWAIGPIKDISIVLDALDQMMDFKNPKDIVRYLSKLDRFLYNTIGDDIFHDDIDGAKREAKEGNMDRAMNRLSDAYSRATYFLERQMDREGLKEETVNEGVWSLGTAEQIVKAIQSLEMLQGMDAASIADSLEDDGKFYYNVLGDDLFHDALDNAERSAAMGDIDRAQNNLADAIGRAEDLLKHVRERESARPYKTDIFNEVASKLAKQLKSK